MRRNVVLVSLLLLALPFAASADSSSIATLPDHGTVSISGKIENVESSREFMLRDDSGAIEVKLVSVPATPLKNGQNVTISGDMVEGFFGPSSRSIDAKQIEIRPVSRTITTSDLAKVKPVPISELPAQGLVKVVGNVGNISNSQAFILRDATGNVNVALDSAAKASFPQGATVTVVGYVDKGGSSKSIHATHVIYQ